MTLWIVMLVYNLVIVGGMLTLATRNPRFARRGMPPSLKAVTEPLTKEEGREAFLWGAPVIAVMFLVPFGYLLWSSLTGEAGFWPLWRDGFLLLFSFNLVDLVLVDWLVFCLWTPSFLVVPGTEGHPAYKDYGFHFRGFLKGTVIVAVMATAFAGLAWGTGALLRGAA